MGSAQNAVGAARYLETRDSAEFWLAGENMKASVSVVVYRESPEVLSCLLECLAGSHRVAEVVVADNSETAELRRTVESFSSMRYLWFGKNLGFGAGHNRAFSVCSSKAPLHLVLNPDVRFDAADFDGWIDWQAAQNDIVLSTPQVLNADGTIQFVCRKIPTPWSMLLRRLNGFGMTERFIEKDELGRIDTNEIREVPFCHGCCMLFQSRVFRELGGFDERFFLYMEDADIFLRAKAFGKTVQNPSFSVVHEYRKGSASSLKLLGLHLHSAWHFFRKHGIVFRS